MGPELVLLAATVVSAGAAVAQGVQASNAAKANAKALEADAIATQQSARLQEQQSRRQTARLLATQRARFGKAGVTLQGTPLLVQDETAAEGELEARIIRFGGNVDATSLRNSAAVQRSEASALRTGGFLNAGQTLLAGADAGAFGSRGRTTAPTGPKTSRTASSRITLGTGSSFA
ncbi:MAG: hypothetical protein AAF563_12360 [Pseudomonadota bacterium]